MKAKVIITERQSIVVNNVEVVFYPQHMKNPGIVNVVPNGKDIFVDPKTGYLYHSSWLEFDLRKAFNVQVGSFGTLSIHPFKDSLVTVDKFIYDGRVRVNWNLSIVREPDDIIESLEAVLVAVKALKEIV